MRDPNLISGKSAVPLVSNIPVNVYQMGSTFSGKFHVTNDVRQGGVLSPLLFNVYVNELSECLNKIGIGGSMNVTIINHMLYADDIMYHFSLFSRFTTIATYK